MGFLDENAVVEVSALYNFRGLVDAVMGLLGTFFGAPNPPKKASKWVPKTVLKNEPQKASQKASSGPQLGAPKGSQNGLGVAKKGWPSLIPIASCWKHAILTPPGPFQGPFWAPEGSILEPLGGYFGVPSGLIWGPFGGSRGSVLLPFFKACVRPRKGQFCGLRELISVPFRDIWGGLSWPLRQKRRNRNRPKNTTC